ncbi:MAG TPA: tetratricopeptide repeat protein [Panacibacter sp.]|nr:tetratricopeptide repeat protein [Panacibacter sp.]HNP46296.1 tetratricopeptide repeat protein [Panacibacter sp.]
MKKYLLFVLALGTITLNSFAQATAKEFYDKGIKLIEDKDYENALAAFKNTLAKDAVYPDASYRAGWCCNELELYSDAITYLEKARKLNDKEAKTFFELGYAYENLSKNDDALVSYKKTLELYPEYYDAAMKVGNLYYGKNDYQSALDYYLTYLKSDDVDNFYYYRAGWCCNDLEKYNDALNYLQQYNPEENDDKAKKYEEIAYSYYSLEKNDDAIENYKTALGYSPDHGTALRGLGNVYYDTEDYDEAQKYFEQAISSDEENSKNCYYKLGWIYNDKEQYDDAVNILKKAVEYDPEDAGNREEIGFAYYMKENNVDALAQLKKAVELDSKSKLGYYYMGLCYLDMGKKEEAKTAYEKLKTISEEQAAKLLEKINAK